MGRVIRVGGRYKTIYGDLAFCVFTSAMAYGVSSDDKESRDIWESKDISLCMQNRCYRNQTKQLHSTDVEYRKFVRSSKVNMQAEPRTAEI